MAEHSYKIKKKKLEIQKHLGSSKRKMTIMMFINDEEDCKMFKSFIFVHESIMQLLMTTIKFLQVVGTWKKKMCTKYV